MREIIKIGDTYHGWEGYYYEIASGWSESIRYVTSPDGLNWTVINQPALKGARFHNVIKEGASYRMWVAPDGDVNYTGTQSLRARTSGNPGSGWGHWQTGGSLVKVDGNQEVVGVSRVRRLATGMYELFYQDGMKINVATSEDGVNFTTVKIDLIDMEKVLPNFAGVGRYDFMVMEMEGEDWFYFAYCTKLVPNGVCIDPQMAVSRPIKIRQEAGLFGFIGHYFVSIDQTTGDATLIKEFPELSGNTVRSLTYDPYSNAFFGVIDHMTDPQLIRIDPNNIELSVVGPIDLATQELKLVEGLTFDSIGKRLYGTGSTTPSTSANILLTIDPLTGTATEVGTLVGTTDIDALVFRQNSFYGADAASNNPNILYSIDQVTAQATNIGAIGFENVNDLAYVPETDTIFGFDRSDRLLVAISPTTGQGTAVGPTHTLAEFGGLTMSSLTAISPPSPANLTITANAIVENEFVFSGIEPNETFTLTSQTPNNQKTFTVAPGTYTVKEHKDSFPGSNWSLIGVACEGNATPITFDSQKAEAIIPVAADEMVSCIFLNEPTTYEGGNHFIYLPVILNSHH